MSDNVVSNPGVGGATFASDDIGGVQYPRAKVVWGVDGAAVDASASNPLPVVQTGTPALPTGAATEATLAAASGKLPAALGQAASAASLSVVVASDQSTIPVSLASVPSHAVTNAGTFAVQASSVVPGTGATNLGKAEDAAHSSGDVGVMSLFVRNDTRGTLSGTDGDYTPGQLNASGDLRVDASAVAVPVTDNSGSLTVDNGGTFAVQAAQSGTWTVQPGNTANTTAWKVDASSVAVPITDNSGSITVDNGGTFAVQASGNVASAATDSGNPVKIGGKYNSSPITVTDGQRADIQTDANGYLKVNVAAGGASGGTSSSFGSSVPATGTAAGFSDGTNMQLGRVFDLDSGAGTQYGLGVNLRKIASGGSVEAGTSSDPLRTDPTGTTAQPITDNSGSLTVDNGGTFAVQAAQSGTWTVQPGNTANTTAWKVDGSAVTQPVSLAAAAGAIAKAEDSASADADVGVPALAVRKATPANTSGTDGDYEFLQMSAGRLWASATIDAALPAGSNTIGALTANQSVNTAQINGVTPLMGNGASGTGAQRVTLANDSTGQVIALGAAAHGASIAGAPVREGLRALTADFTALTTGQTADAVSTVLGKQIVLPYCLPGQAWKYVSAAGGIVTTTAITIAAAAGAGVKNYITSITLVNSHQTIGTEVVINDGAAGTAIFRTWCQFLGGGVSIKCDPPLSSTANTLLEIKEVTTTGTAGIVAFILGYTAAE